METLSAPYVLEYTYQRSTGPVIGRFLTGLRAGRIEGVRTASGRVLVPPLEYDPDTGEATGEVVEVASSGVVTTWAWVTTPRPGHPLPRPFAWALIRLDGADTGLFHAVDAGSADAICTGARVTARWRAERIGSIRDIECFELAEAPSQPGGRPGERGRVSDVKIFQAPIRLEYTVTAGRHLSTYLRALADGRIVGGRCPACTKVYLPPRGACPTCGVPADALVEVADRGTVTTFCVINIPFDAAPFPPPYAAIAVLLDGADLPIFHLLRGIPPHDTRMGMRVRAVWAPAEAREPTLASIRWFEPSDDPAAPFDSYASHL
jgi:uncharacterized protein